MRFEVLDVRIDPITMDAAVRLVQEKVTSRTKAYIVFCTVSTILAARAEPRLRDAIDKAALVTPDGMPLVWLGGRRQPKPIERVYGPDFMRTVMSSEETAGLRHFFFGGTPATVEKVVRNIRATYPSAVIAGAHSPPFQPVTPETVGRDASVVNAAAPDVVWVGLGHPKQELWMLHSQHLIDAPVMAGVGAAFDFLAGDKKEAPRWMQGSGLQWLHRLLSEPRRLWKRYLVGNLVFAGLLLKESATARFQRKSP